METHALNVAQAITDFEPKKNKNGETMTDEEWDELAKDERNLLEKRRRGRFATIQVPKPVQEAGESKEDFEDRVAEAKKERAKVVQRNIRLLRVAALRDKYPHAIFYKCFNYKDVYHHANKIMDVLDEGVVPQATGRLARLAKFLGRFMPRNSSLARSFSVETDDGQKMVRGKRDTLDPTLGIVDLDGDGRANAVVRLSDAQWKVQEALQI